MIVTKEQVLNIMEVPVHDSHSRASHQYNGGTCVLYTIVIQEQVIHIMEVPVYDSHSRASHQLTLYHRKLAPNKIDLVKIMIKLTD